AGVHLLLSLDLRTGAVEVLAGTTVEGLRDGPALDGWLAQPSGLAADGDRLWFVDAETSALRYLTLDGELHTAIGEGLFDFGLVDGTLVIARMQHPLGVTLLPGGALAVADTFNGAVRWFDPVTGVLSTLATGLAEPASVVVDGDDLLVVESAAGRVRRMPQPTPIALRPGRVHLRVELDVPSGQVPDDRDGPAARLDVTASPASVLASGAGTGTELQRTLEVAGAGLVHAAARLATCDDASAVHPACHVHRIERAFAVRIDSAGPNSDILMS
ncbi:MAG: alkyl hydroperoxide reductase, partial [Jatrophihabitans endophyticus]|nr:alkyl hydroperoxide reductase [Jatrophihabitans endophyticus]